MCLVTFWWDVKPYSTTVCLSVCLSVILVYYVETTELIINQLALDCSLGL